MSDRDGRAALLAASMPDDLAALLEVAEAAVDELHAAVLAGDDEASERATDLYETAIWKLNGGTFFGCRADENRPGCFVERHCQAAPGNVPKWGQAGIFLVTVGSMRVLVEFGGGMDAFGCHFEFQAVDLDRPFISETGYLSHFGDLHAGQTVDQAAGTILAGYLKEGRSHQIEPDSRDHLAEKPVPDWLAELEPPPRWTPATIEVPPGFVLVDVILPAHRAFVARKWAKQARIKIEAIEGLERCRQEPEQKAAKAAKVDAKGEWRRSEGHLVKYRIRNGNGRRAINFDPKCVQSFYSFDQLRADNITRSDE